jgi:hypothetical protein
MGYKETMLSSRHLKDVIYLILCFILFFLIRVKVKQFVSDEQLQTKVEAAAFFSLFGLLHIFANNLLSFLYDMRSALSPFKKPFLVEITPKNIRIVGIILLVISLIAWFTLLLQIKAG